MLKPLCGFWFLCCFSSGKNNSYFLYFWKQAKWPPGFIGNDVPVKQSCLVQNLDQHFNIQVSLWCEFHSTQLYWFFCPWTLSEHLVIPPTDEKLSFPKSSHLSCGGRRPTLPGASLPFMKPDSPQGSERESIMRTCYRATQLEVCFKFLPDHLKIICRLRACGSGGEGVTPGSFPSAALRWVRAAEPFDGTTLSCLCSSGNPNLQWATDQFCSVNDLLSCWISVPAHVVMVVLWAPPSRNGRHYSSAFLSSLKAEWSKTTTTVKTLEKQNKGYCRRKGLVPV